LNDMKPKVSSFTERLKKRFNVFTVLFVISLAVIAGRLFLIKVVDGDSYSQVTNARTKYSDTVLAKRGDILDRNNVLLATSTVQYQLIIDPAVLLEEGDLYLDHTAYVIEKCFKRSAQEVKEIVKDNPERRYMVLESEIPYSGARDFIELSNAINAIENKDDKAKVLETLGYAEDYKGPLKIIGARLEDSYNRNYAYGTFASSVLGFVREGEGLYGMEKYYNEDLSGIDGRQYSYVNDENVVEYIYRDKQDGNTIQSTLDYNIQSIVEKHMMDMQLESGAKTVAVTIQDPNSGEFLAMADSGIFDPNDPWDLSVRYSEYEIEQIKSSDELQSGTLTENWKNFCVADSYEPGSTFKAFTVASALEEGCITKDQYFFCDGSVPMLDYTIHCAYIDGHGEISLKDALAQSCNIALMDIAATEGVDVFCKYQSQFGFGSYTDIDLPNEMSCKNLIYTRENMTDLDLAVNSFGQSFNVTMVQMSSAFCSLINGGIYYKPHIVKGIYNSNGELIKSIGKTVVSRPVSEDTSDFIKYSLRHVVTEGTGTTASVGGYITAGKTGTAQKGRRNDDLWVASFIGFAPYENPQLVCYVVIDEPASGGDGSSAYACELFSRIMSEVLPYINATPASMDYDPAGVGSPDNNSPADSDEEADGWNEDQEEGEIYQEDPEQNDYYDENTGYEENLDENYYEEGDYDENSWYDEDEWY